MSRRLKSAPEWLPLAQRMREEGFLLREIATRCETTTGNADYWLNHEIRQERRGRNLDVYLYFLQADWGGPIKIGFGTAHRLTQLKSSSAEDLIIRRRIRCSDRLNARALERDLHKNFAHLRLRGEWFRPNAALAEMAKAKINMDRLDAEVYESEERKLTAQTLRAAHGKGYEAGKAAGYSEGWEAHEQKLLAENLRRIA